MRKVVRILLFAALGIAALVGVIMYATSGIVRVSDEWIASLKDPDSDRGYGSLSNGFRANFSPAQFGYWVDGHQLGRITDRTWSSREVNMESGKLEGTLTLDTGEDVPSTLLFIRENGAWKLNAVTLTRDNISGILDGPIAMPPQDELLSLAHRNMVLWVNCLNRGDMAPLYDDVALLWKAQATPDALQEAFAAFTPMAQALTVLERLQPGLAQVPELLQDGVMVVRGRYPTRPTEVTFTHRYMLEGGNWRLLELSVSTREVEGDAQQAAG